MMKKYLTPSMKVMAFMPEEEISVTASRSGAEGGLTGSNTFNDGEFGTWG